MLLSRYSLFASLIAIGAIAFTAKPSFAQGYGYQPAYPSDSYGNGNGYTGYQPIRPNYDQHGYEPAADAQAGYPQRSYGPPAYEGQGYQQRPAYDSSAYGANPYAANPYGVNQVAYVKKGAGINVPPGAVSPVPESEPSVSYEPSFQPGCTSCGTPGAACGSTCDTCCNPHNWYVVLGGAWSNRGTVHEVGDPATFIEWDSGFGLNTAIGHRFSCFRVEAEFSFMNNEVALAGAGIPNVGNFVSPANGNVSLKTYMLNFYHDIQIKDWWIKPYVGFGIGFYQSEINSLLPDFFTTLGTPTLGVNTTSNIPFAYQFRAGLTYPIGERTEFYFGYRYFKGEELTFAAEPFGVFHPDGAKINQMEAGLRINF